MNLLNEIEKIYPELALFFGENLEKFKNAPKSKLNKYHFGAGLWLRNNFLYNNLECMEMFRKCGVSAPDDMSDLILSLFHNHLNSLHSG
jgi:hypothetical protein